VTAQPPRSCAECAGPLAEDQRYCLACGRRAVPAPKSLVRARAWARAGWAPRVPSTGAAAVGGANAPRGSRQSLLRIPSAPVSVVLIAVFLGFGVILGAAAKGPTQGALASANAPRLKLVLPPARSSPHGGGGSRSGEAGSGGEASAGTETPAGEPEPGAAATGHASHPATTGSPANRTASSESSASGGSGSAGSSSEGSSAGSPAGAATTLPPIKHVFVVMLSDQPYATVFGPASTAPYIAHTLAAKGEVLARYDAVAHEELPNEIALLSGQGGTVQTASDCPVYSDVLASGAGPDGQVLGEGCVYPASTQTLPGQLAAKHLAARAYVEGIDEPGTPQSSPCAHPPAGASDPTSARTASNGPYATFRNPFVYFRSITASPACASEDVGLSRLASDLKSARQTPALSYVVPDRCHDASPTPCSPGAPTGLAPAEGFLERVVPEIMRSPAYRQAGLLVITTDEAPSSGEYADSGFCCGQPSFPNLPSTGTRGHGGGTVGAMLLSPYVKHGVTNQERFNHFSLLHTIEALFSLRPLGYAALPEEKAFEAGMFLAHPAR
jgi:phosphatidylinositol-3-phosphatase